jgi:hypothetical protein
LRAAFERARVLGDSVPSGMAGLHVDDYDAEGS